LKEKCVICGDSNIFYPCLECGRNFCLKHTGFNEIYYCSKHKVEYDKKKMLKYKVLDKKCHIINKTICPKCKNGLFLEQNHKEKSEFYFSCSSCDWNSKEFQPTLLDSDINELITSARKNNILKTNNLQYCNLNLKLLETSNQNFCYGCLINELEKGDTFTSAQISELTHISKEKIFSFLKELKKEKLLNGVVDALTKSYISLPPAYEEILLMKLKNVKIDLRDISRETGFEERLVRLIVLNIVQNNPQIDGKFIDVHTFANNEILIDEIMKIINQGATLISELAAKYQLKTDEIKELIGYALERKLIKAFYSPDGEKIIPGESLQNKIMDLLEKRGKINIEQVSISFMIDKSTLLDTLKQLIANKQVNGIYTLDNGFATVKYLENAIHNILKKINMIDLDKLSNQLNTPKKFVEQILFDLINNNKISGSIIDNVFQRSQKMDYEKKRLPSLGFLNKKVEDINNLQYILIIHKETGTNLFNYPCSELELNSDLLSGFLQAITTFGSEIDLNKSSSLEEIRWHGFVIALSEGKFIKSAFFCKSSPSTTLKANIKYFIINFENKYKNILEKWTGKSIAFQNIFELIDKFFKVGSKILFFIPRYSEEVNKKEKIIEKIHKIVEKHGRIQIDKILNFIQIQYIDLMDILSLFIFDGIGLFSKDKKEFITESQILNEIAEFILNIKEFNIDFISKRLNLDTNDTFEIIQKLINDGKINAEIKDNIIKIF